MEFLIRFVDRLFNSCGCLIIVGGCGLCAVVSLLGAGAQIALR